MEHASLLEHSLQISRGRVWWIHLCFNFTLEHDNGCWIGNNFYKKLVSNMIWFCAFLWKNFNAFPWKHTKKMLKKTKTIDMCSQVSTLKADYDEQVFKIIGWKIDIKHFFLFWVLKTKNCFQKRTQTGPIQFSLASSIFVILARHLILTTELTIILASGLSCLHNRQSS